MRRQPGRCLGWARWSCSPGALPAGRTSRRPGLVAGGSVGGSSAWGSAPASTRCRSPTPDSPAAATGPPSWPAEAGRRGDHATQAVTDVRRLCCTACIARRRSTTLLGLVGALRASSLTLSNRKLGSGVLSSGGASRASPWRRRVRSTTCRLLSRWRRSASRRRQLTNVDARASGRARRRACERWRRQREGTGVLVRLPIRAVPQLREEARHDPAPRSSTTRRCSGRATARAPRRHRRRGRR